MVTTFTSIEESFAWFLEHIYKKLPAGDKKGELVNAWRSFTFKQGISQKRMISIMRRYGFEVNISVTYEKQFFSCAMKRFSSVTESFKWWLTEIYPNLPPDMKKGRLTTAWRDFTYDQGISERRMKSILEEFGKVEVRTEVLFFPN